MPTYTFVCAKCGDESDRSVDAGRRTVTCRCGGLAEMDWGKTFQPCHARGSGDRMYWSEALGVHPKEVSEVIENDRRAGTMAAVYREDGVLGFRSWEQKRRYEKANGFVEG